MKLLNCLSCNDIISLIDRPRTCKCNKMIAVYLKDGKHAIYHHKEKNGRIIGISNTEYKMSLEKYIVLDSYEWFTFPNDWIEQSESNIKECEAIEQFWNILKEDQKTK